jgi:hypothetical protein
LFGHRVSVTLAVGIHLLIRDAGLTIHLALPLAIDATPSCGPDKIIPVFARHGSEAFRRSGDFDFLIYVRSYCREAHARYAKEHPTYYWSSGCLRSESSSSPPSHRDDGWQYVDGSSCSNHCADECCDQNWALEIKGCKRLAQFHKQSKRDRHNKISDKYRYD